MGQHEQALELLDRAHAIAPDAYEVLVSRGHTLSSLGRHAEAVEALEAAVRQQPTAQALNALSRSYQDLGG